MRNWLLIFFLSSVLAEVQAQGLCGRRMSVEAEFDYTMRYFEPTEHFFSVGGKARVGYVVARHWQVYAGINYYRLNLLQPVYDTVNSNAPLLGDASDHIICKEIDLTARYFLSGFGKRIYNCVAPDGKYIEFSIIGTRTNYTAGDLSTYAYSFNPTTPIPEVTTARISVGIGNQQVWWDRMIVNTGLIGSVPVYKWTEYNEYTGPYMSWQRGHNYIRAYVSVGILL